MTWHVRWMAPRSRLRKPCRHSAFGRASIGCGAGSTGRRAKVSGPSTSLRGDAPRRTRQRSSPDSSCCRWLHAPASCARRGFRSCAPRACCSGQENRVNAERNAWKLIICRRGIGHDMPTASDAAVPKAMRHNDRTVPDPPDLIAACVRGAPLCGAHRNSPIVSTLVSR